MKVAFLTFPVAGHAYPMTTLARRLKARGHDGVSVGFSDDGLSFGPGNSHSCLFARKNILLVRIVRS